MFDIVAAPNRRTVGAGVIPESCVTGMLHVLRNVSYHDDARDALAACVLKPGSLLIQCLHAYPELSPVPRLHCLQTLFNLLTRCRSTDVSAQVMVVDGFTPLMACVGMVGADGILCHAMGCLARVVELRGGSAGDLLFRHHGASSVINNLSCPTPAVVEHALWLLHALAGSSADTATALVRTAALHHYVTFALRSNDRTVVARALETACVLLEIAPAVAVPAFGALEDATVAVLHATRGGGSGVVGGSGGAAAGTGGGFGTGVVVAAPAGVYAAGVLWFGGEEALNLRVLLAAVRALSALAVNAQVVTAMMRHGAIAFLKPVGSPGGGGGLGEAAVWCKNATRHVTS